MVMVRVGMILLLRSSNQEGSSQSLRNGDASSGPVRICNRGQFAFGGFACSVALAWNF